jgi:outer membrane protein
MQKMADAGSIAQGDLLNIKAQYSSENAQVIQSQNTLKMAYLSLMQLMDLPTDTVFSIEQPSIELTPGFGKLLEARMVYDFAIQNRPEIKSAETNLSTSLVDLSIARSSFYPRLSITAGYGSGYSGANSILDGNPAFAGFFPNGDMTSAGDTVFSPMFNYKYATKSFQNQITDNKNYSFGLNLTVPIFNNCQTYNNVQLSKIAIQQAELKLQQEKNTLRKTIEQSYADASSAANTYQAAESQVKARQETMNYATQKFEAGMMNAFEFNDAKIKLDAAKSDLLNAKYEYVFRVKVLDFYFGRPLNL